MRSFFAHLLSCCLFGLTAISAAPVEDSSGAKKNPELQFEFALMNQKALRDFQMRNPELYLYSLIPRNQNVDYFRDFEATFFMSDGRRLTHEFRYVKMNDIWQPRMKNILDAEMIQKSNSKP